MQNTDGNDRGLCVSSVCFFLFRWREPAQAGWT